MTEKLDAAQASLRRRRKEGAEQVEAAPAESTAPVMICASCGQATRSDPCSECGKVALLGGRYRLDEVIGRGGMGVTYRATHVTDRTTVAIKEIAYRHARDPKDLELGRREAEVLKQLTHARIPRYRDHFVWGEGKHIALFIVQDFIRGRSLNKEAEKRRYDEREVLDILDGVLEVLEYLHQLSPPVIHRDIKPSNVMRRDEDGAIFVIDFGTVRDALKDPRIGGSTVAGTYGYMAPEQFEGRATAATDLYALGVLAVALFSREDPTTMMRNAARLEWEDRVSARPAIKELLRSLLEPDPAKRASSATEVRQRIAELRSGRDTDSAGAHARKEKRDREGGQVAEGGRVAERARPAASAAARVEAPLTIGRVVRLAVASAMIFAAGAGVALKLATSPSAAHAVASRHAPVQSGGQGQRSYSGGAYHDHMPPENIKHWCDKNNFMRACARYAEILYERGDHEQALQYGARACNAMNVNACARLSNEYKRSADRAREVLKRACENGSAPACQAVDQSP